MLLVHHMAPHLCQVGTDQRLLEFQDTEVLTLRATAYLLHQEVTTITLI
jgi:hypothetical protein